MTKNYHSAEEDKMEGLMFPKTKKKKRRKKHKPSILHTKDGTCYLCMRLHNDYRIHAYTEEHHVFGGNPNRDRSEAEGLKVYLCPEHHRTGPEAVHNNHDNMLMVQQDAQRVFEQTYSRKEFVKLIGRNYLE